MSSGINVSIRLENLDAVRDHFNKLAGGQARAAFALALNDVGHFVRREMAKEFRAEFDRPTPYIAGSPKFLVDEQQLSVKILPTLDARNQPSKGGKVGVDPQYILQAQEQGGRRADKRSEVLLRRAGFLPPGMQTVIPTDPYPGSDDGRGNLRGAFVSQLISYLQASGEQGFRQNMKGKARAKLEDRTRMSLLSNKREVSLIRGVAYFVSHGKLRGSHLPPGVWAKTGTHGANIKPVLMFVRAATYSPRISMDGLVQKADVQNYLDRRVRSRIREAAGV